MITENKQLFLWTTTILLVLTIYFNENHFHESKSKLDKLSKKLDTISTKLAKSNKFTKDTLFKVNNHKLVGEFSSRKIHFYEYAVTYPNESNLDTFYMTTMQSIPLGKDIIVNKDIINDIVN